MMYCEVNVGERIRYFRNLRGWSQETLALQAEINPAFLGHLEQRTEKSNDKNTGKDRAGARHFTGGAVADPQPVDMQKSRHRTGVRPDPRPPARKHRAHQRDRAECSGD